MEDGFTIFLKYWLLFAAKRDNPAYKEVESQVIIEEIFAYKKDKELIEKIILDKQVEYQKQILEFNAEQKDYTAASLVESKSEKLNKRSVGDFYKELLVEFRKSDKEGNRLVYK